MAQLEVQVKYCDPCKGKTRAAATRHFEWFGAKYTLDVCEKHDAGLKAALDRWIDVARCTTVSLATPGPVAAPTGLYDVVVPLPGPQDRWRFTRHAEERMVERQVNRDVAKLVAERPDSTGPSRKHPGLSEHYGQGLVVVVDPAKELIITVAGEQRVAVG